MTKLRLLPRLFWSRARQKAYQQEAQQQASNRAPRALPAPLPLAMRLDEALSKRRSRRRFKRDPLPDEVLATLLWAADGITGEAGRRTTPSSLNWQEVDLYVLLADGVWRWDAVHNVLLPHMDGDWRAVTGLPGQSALNAPVQFAFVACQARTEHWATNLGTGMASLFLKDWSDADIARLLDRSMTIDVGVKLQAITLAATALKLHSVVRAGFDIKSAERQLGLSAGENLMAVVSVGYPPEE